MSKLQLALIGTGGVLGILIIVWLAWGGMSYSTATDTITIERSIADKYRANNDPHLIDNMHFIERARAIETGFKAAFLFHR